MRVACNVLPISRHKVALSAVWHYVVFRVSQAAPLHPRPRSLAELQLVPPAGSFCRSGPSHDGAVTAWATAAH